MSASPMGHECSGEQFPWRELAQRLGEAGFGAPPHRPALDVEGELTSAALAPVMASLLAAPQDTAELRRSVVEELLGETVRWASDRSPFYRQHLACFAGTRGSLPVARLTEVEPLDRERVQSAGPRLRAAGLDLAFSTYTSGTTNGQPLVVDRSVQEQQFIWELVTRLRALGSLRPSVTLALATLYHGRQIQLPAGGPVRLVSLAGEGGLKQAATLLERHAEPAGDADETFSLVGGLVAVQMLTTYLEQAGASDLAGAVHSVRTSSYLLTRKTAERLGHFWGVPPEDRYALTEVWAGATLCDLCCMYHFDPHVIVEVLAPSGQPLTRGRGHLALTSLVPFSLMTPLVRYMPGDIVERRESDCPRGDSAYRFLGRGRSAVIGEHSSLTAADVAEALDGLPDVNRPLLHAGLPEHLRDVTGLPIFEVDGDRRPEPRVLVELRYRPADFPERVTELHAGITRSLQGPICVDFVGPGGLQRDSKFRL